MKESNDNTSDNELWDLVKQSTRELNINNSKTKSFSEKIKNKPSENKKLNHVDANFRKVNTNTSANKKINHKKPVNLSNENNTLGVNRSNIKKMRAGNLNIN